MASRKISDMNSAEFEKIIRDLERLRQEDDKSTKDAEFLNPWNFGKKNIAGRSIICASLPKELPED